MYVDTGVYEICFICRFSCIDIDVWRKFWFQWIKQLNAPLEVIDPEIADIIELEKARQWKVYIYIFYCELFSGSLYL